ncbi:MAG: bifunctional demethylmenaquinone methyltransferase/2-methoxy-6-polyprenyl-1,4-benzoquinol methylase UbiE [Rickettsiales bacterium]|nr:bifunctional demethylmenaquinone methyltransferase/2-methoxy-6-polyprenyl-1,4-benzoquinol methylase UbiE [Rickettsiales bacterium]
MTQTKTHFGFQTVDADQKADRVYDVFASVASNYDIMNDLMSLGVHRIWKREMIKRCHLSDSHKVLDLAGGTGDIAFLMRKNADVDVTVCDINDEMLKEGQKRAFDRSEQNCEWVCGNAESLPLPSMHYDRCTIAFGIRNVTDIPKALRDIHRVLKPGGKFICLEFSEVTAPMLKKLYDEYSFSVIPKIGKYIANDEAAYQYLVESIRQFPRQEAFATMIREAGFENVDYQNMSNGVVAIHTGWKI